MTSTVAAQAPRSCGVRPQRWASRPESARSGAAQARGVREQHVPQRLRAVLRDGDVDALSLRREVVADGHGGAADVAVQLADVGEVHEPVAVHAEKRATERRLDRRQRQVDIEPALASVHEGEPVRRLEGPDALGIEEDEALLAPRHYAARTLGQRPPALEDTFETLLDALFVIRLQDVVDDAQI